MSSSKKIIILLLADQVFGFNTFEDLLVFHRSYLLWMASLWAREVIIL